ncbi:RNA polymerase sigma-70 factor (ECF subfamily) [Chitinophaga terrae (ex Kim and Jung 2007)]|uniref:RNA polymerase sigma-70 factor n=1 Tax=Chitinophaga terrae (ex Kim and Jung 2007) TaxID=408074 RepID=UPI00277E442C|nr:RNA polymerase sigma-70 factor [Chitinophaga terrae (ex Kim and Jung 2007)]MDQ0110238.1 RNA polymerase sigma-70 factor (ECF subfamily) [Chitinophaga terrae (ex Kim and Jung 2007)]
MLQEKISNSVDRWLQGDDTAFEAVFLYFRPRLLRYTFRYLKNETASEDLTTEVLVKAWQNKSSITNPATFENYLFTIARNKLIKAWQKRVDILLALDAAGEPTEPAAANDPVLYKELELRYRKSLESLPEQRRRIFLLHREQHLSYRQIAEQLHISPKTVENQVAATLKQLRSQLAQSLASLIL